MKGNTCWSPVNLTEPITTKDGREVYMIPCGNCLPCLKRKAGEWAVRVKAEQKATGNALFVTFTYNDNSLPEAVDEETGELIPTLRKKHLQDFWKRLRGNLKRDKQEVRLKYFAIGEYGATTQRPHYHAIVFNVPVEKNVMYFEKNWNMGAVDIQWAEDGSIHYVTGYLIAKDNQWNKDRVKEKVFQVSSKGLGMPLITEKTIKNIKNDPKPYLIGEGGQKLVFSRYYREKILTEAERAIIAEKGEAYQMEQFELIRPTNIDYYESVRLHNEHIKNQTRKFKKLQQQKRKTI